MHAIAQKHIDICVHCAQVFRDWGYDVYIGTHRGRDKRHGYREAELESKEAFWGVRAYTSEKPGRKSRVKDPDLVAVYGGMVKYVAEIKWGAVEGVKTTDIDSVTAEKDWNAIRNMVTNGRSIWVKGPLIENGQAVKGGLKLPFTIDEDTQLLIISDFDMLSKKFPDKLGTLKSKLVREGGKIHIIDHQNDLNDIPSLESYLKNETIEEVLEKCGDNFFEVLRND